VPIGYRPDIGTDADELKEGEDHCDPQGLSGCDDVETSEHQGHRRQYSSQRDRKTVCYRLSQLVGLEGVGIADVISQDLGVDVSQPCADTDSDN
jgi:hypothetical protein